MKSNKHPKKFFRHLISTPFIHMMIIPLIIFDLFLEIYHNVCFRLYQIPLRKRSLYIRIDRQKLKYLNPIEKLNCMYCGYANGFIHYAFEIAGDTEGYWCAIKHQKSKNFKEPPHHKNFAEYGNEKDLK
ncbi:hypothetical protein HOD20_06790 [archaeon]|jgi:hypothetical protein|nr:hypothetical protein [archaeon]MBT4352211.1 hypothetical protein [archaeon]MBT4647334.1 hypothetical protein [archaeon]MBT6821230.1 hypothetical protein [archaeon]MBT7391282.1 hypothetical protein [archaeon]